MKRITLGILLLVGTGLFADIKIQECKQTQIDKRSKIFVCENIQYLIEYHDELFDVAKVITIVVDGKVTVIKK